MILRSALGLFETHTTGKPHAQSKPIDCMFRKPPRVKTDKAYLAMLVASA